MSKVIKKFGTISEYNAYTADTANFYKPNVSLITDDYVVKYNPTQTSVTYATVTCDSATYNGERQKPTNIVVTISGVTLTENVDYTISNNIGGVNASKYSFTVNGIGDYKGSRKCAFIINKKQVTAAIELSESSYIYDGTAKQPTVTAKDGTVVIPPSEYTVSYSNNINAGTAIITVTDNENGNYTVNGATTFTISPKTVNSPTITLSETSYIYDGTAKQPTATVKDGTVEILPSEYTVSYSNNTNAGTATVTITDKSGGNYNVNGSTTFTINKASRTISFVSLPTEFVVDDTVTIQTSVSAGQSDGTVTFTSSDTSKATFNGNVLTCVSDGNVTITATISEGTNYQSATTSTAITIENGEVVDLGLSVNWCSHNVGATNPEEVGVFFSWGGREGYPSGDTSLNYFTWCNYNNMPGRTLRSNIPSGSSYDAAHVRMGGNWRMPTQAEATELVNNCDWEYTTYKGVSGWRATSKIAGYTSKSIFIPVFCYYFGSLTPTCNTGNTILSTSTYQQRASTVTISCSGGLISINVDMVNVLTLNASSHSIGVQPIGYGGNIRAVQSK